MNAVFADTFYWAALTNIDDPANERALTISRSIAPDRIVTTDEVLAEYLTFFSGARPSIWDRVGRNVARYSIALKFALCRRAVKLSLPVSSFTATVSTKGTVWSIVFRCKRCAEKA